MRARVCVYSTLSLSPSPSPCPCLLLLLLVLFTSPCHASATNLDLAFTVASEQLDVPKLLDVEDITDCKRPDEKIIMPYLAFMFKACANLKRIDGFTKSVKRAMDVSGRHSSYIQQYLAAAEKLKAWMAAISEQYTPHTYGNTLAAIEERWVAFTTHKGTPKPKQRGLLTAMEGIYNTLNAACRNKGRPEVCIGAIAIARIMHLAH
jgi:hypothetical protein